MEETFEPYRTYLFAIAYRMLGSALDAEDMVQKTYQAAQAQPSFPQSIFDDHPDPPVPGPTRFSPPQT